MARRSTSNGSLDSHFFVPSREPSDAESDDEVQSYKSIVKPVQKKVASAPKEKKKRGKGSIVINLKTTTLPGGGSSSGNGDAAAVAGVSSNAPKPPLPPRRPEAPAPPTPAKDDDDAPKDDAPKDSPEDDATAEATDEVGLPLPGVRLVTWTILAVASSGVWTARTVHSRVSDWLHGPSIWCFDCKITW
jgi:hypothetical protein